MAQHVFVENVGSATYEDEFRGQKISIPVGGRIKMQRREALIFLGCMSPTGSDGKPAEKKLRLIPVDGEPTETAAEVKKEHICNLDGQKFDTQQELDDHLKKLSSRTVTRDQLDAAKRKEG
jgi:hypothetical protein